MDLYIKVNRISKTNPDHNLTGKSEVERYKTLIDLTKVEDYEEYKGDIAEEGKSYTLVLVEHRLSTEWKIIEYSFEEFHALYLKYQAYLDKLESTNFGKLN